MYDVAVTNNYIYPISLEMEGWPPPSQSIPPNGGQYTYQGLGNGIMTIAGMGPINFLDLGNQKLDAYTNPELPWTEFTWGGVVRYRGMDAYFRYEGQGTVNVTVDQEGSISLHFDQGGMIVDLDDMTVT
jgi:hypothetical protein